MFTKKYHFYKPLYINYTTRFAGSNAHHNGNH